MASDQQQHLYELLKDFSAAMMITSVGQNSMRARPMAIAELEPGADAYFATSIDSRKIDEIERNPHVLLTFQGPTQFAAVRGTIEVVRDRTLIAKMWREAWRAWFPKGKDDRSLCLLRFAAENGEYWDNAGSNALKYAFEAAKAYATGKTPKTDETQHGKVTL